MILWLVTCLGLAAVARAESPGTEPAVKMSRGGICHERGTVHYRQTIYFEAFDSMQACLAAGGRRMGGEYGADPPQDEYRGTQPPRDYWSYAIVGVNVLAAIVAAVVLPRWRRWKARQAQRTFEERQKRQWEGHKLGPRRP